MAEVLTQSQIDALLNSVKEGGLGEKTQQEKAEKKYRKYDFYSPKKFTKDKLKILNGVYESYARMVSSRLNSILRINCDVEIATVEEQRYYEFSNALNDNDVLTLVHAHLPDDSDNTPVIMHTTAPLMLSMIDRMLGGIGEDSATVSSSYTYTDIEISLYENIIKYIIEIMKDGWSNYLDLDFEFLKLETNPSLMQVIGTDETIVIIILEISMKDMKGKINICLPGTLLSNIFSIFDKRNSLLNKVTTHEEKTADEILGSIKGSTLEIKAKLGETQILLSDVYNLQVGDVINLNKAKDSEINLYVEDKPWFKGKLGVQNKNMAVKISEVFENL